MLASATLCPAFLPFVANCVRSCEGISRRCGRRNLETERPTCAYVAYRVWQARPQLVPNPCSISRPLFGTWHKGYGSRFLLASSWPDQSDARRAGFVQSAMLLLRSVDSLLPCARLPPPPKKKRARMIETSFWLNLVRRSLDGRRPRHIAPSGHF